jgi:hypothetical protein
MGLTRRFALIGLEKNTKKVKTGVLERAYLRVKFSACGGVSSLAWGFGTGSHGYDLALEQVMGFCSGLSLLFVMARFSLPMLYT